MTVAEGVGVSWWLLVPVGVGDVLGLVGDVLGVVLTDWLPVPGLGLPVVSDGVNDG